MARPDQWSPFRGDPPPAAHVEEQLKYIPGTTALRPTAGKDDEPDWWHDPRLSREYAVPTEDGQELVRLYTVGALAAATGKTAVTIRKWIRLGYLPDSGMRTAAIPGTLNDAGRRLWTKEQIEAIVRIGLEERVIGQGRCKAFSETNFESRIRTLWRQRNW